MAELIFQPFCLMAGEDEREIIAIKFIESITIIDDDSEELVIERLKGDRHLYCRMASGKEYQVSMLAQMKRFTKYKMSDDPKELRQAIFEKWYHMVSST